MRIATAALAAIALACVHAGAPLAADADGLFDASELKAFLPDKTFEGETASGSFFSAYFSPDGNVKAQVGTRTILGTWRLAGERYCATFSGNESCARVGKKPDGTHFVRIDGSGRDLPRKITPGDHVN